MALIINLYGAIEPEPTKDTQVQNIARCANDFIALLAAYPNEDEVKVNIHSGGGSVHEGFAIYDTLRTSGRKIYTNIIGDCHSMAVAVLLAAPFENRTANPKIRSLIHLPRIAQEDWMTAQQLSMLAEEIKAEEEAIIALYVERTNLTTEQVVKLINSEKIHNAEELKALGFISRINTYTTNQIKKPMAKDFKETVSSWIARYKNRATTQNYDYKDEDGNILFSTLSDNDNLSEGDTVVISNGETSATFDLPDGRVVVIEENIIVSITQESQEMQDLRNELDVIKNELAKKDSEIANLNSMLEDANSIITSNYVPQNRIATKVSTISKSQKEAVNAQESKEDRRKLYAADFERGFNKKLKTDK